MTARAVGVTERRWRGWIGGVTRLVHWLVAPPTHLASPLEGGRDELGKGWVLAGWWAR